MNRKEEAAKLINKKLNLYYDDVNRGFSEHEYIGLYNQKSVRVIGIIKAIMAEVTDFRRDIQINDNKCNATLNYLENINPSQFIYNKYSDTRQIL